MQTDKEQFMEYAMKRIKEKECKKKIKTNEVIGVNIRSMERSMRRKMGQI